MDGEGGGGVGGGERQGVSKFVRPNPKIILHPPNPVILHSNPRGGWRQRRKRKRKDNY